ncbi:hypothetical protein BC941DRAFT_497928 [Chlamydoabsidia padenii]|nr:hypothetical protein BC941DRAFT_497928 [Chlamydoabsidia padenii]
MIRSSFFLVVYFTILLLSISIVHGQNINTNDHEIISPDTLQNGERILGAELSLNTDDEANEDNEDDNGDEDDEDEMDASTTFDIDQDPLDGEDVYYRLTNNKEQEQGDELGEEQSVEDDEDESNDNNGNDDDDINITFADNKEGLLFEDDEEPLDFRNNEEIDLDQLLFEASQKDTTTEWNDDQQEQHDDIDRLLADDLLDEQQQQNDDEPPLINSIFQETSNSIINTDESSQEEQKQQQQQQQQHRQLHYKLPLFGIIIMLVLLYKVSKKGNHSKSKFLDKEESGLPFHIKDLTIAEVDSAGLIPSPLQDHRRPTRNGAPTKTGHSRRISLGQHYSTIKESIWEDEEEWQDEKRRL